MDGMETRGSRYGPLAVAIAVIVVPLSFYTAGYFAFSRTYVDPFQDDDTYVREFRQQWLTSIYWPLVRGESVLTDKRILTRAQDD